MAGIESVAEEFGKFVRHLRETRPKDVEHIAKLSNGFEGWLKLEFFFWLGTSRGLEPSTFEKGEREIGLEYKVRLDKRGTDRDEKQCDLWVSSEPRKGFHYVELKALFANANQNKVLGSAADDFWYMSKIPTWYEPVSGNAIVVGVGFAEDAAWKQAIKYVTEKAGLSHDMEPPSGGPVDGEGRVRYSVLTKRY
jgi:hypothetical protein